MQHNLLISSTASPLWKLMCKPESWQSYKSRAWQAGPPKPRNKLWSFELSSTHVSAFFLVKYYLFISRIYRSLCNLTTRLFGAYESIRFKRDMYCVMHVHFYNSYFSYFEAERNAIFFRYVMLW